MGDGVPRQCVPGLVQSGACFRDLTLIHLRRERYHQTAEDQRNHEDRNGEFDKRKARRAMATAAILGTRRGECHLNRVTSLNVVVLVPRDRNQSGVSGGTGAVKLFSPSR